MSDGVAAQGHPPLRLGTRGSTLARLQSGLVADALRRAGVDVELVTIVTAGDVRPPDSAWGEGAFVGALERALLDGDVDLAVHSAKDVPIEAEEQLTIAAFPLRADPRDALVRPAGASPIAALRDLPARAVVGTDSPRRTGFLLAARPDLRMIPLHGNVDTRLARLDRGDADVLVLAVAGLVRLGRAERISLVLDPAIVAPAPGQGALAVQVRARDERTRQLVAALDDPATRAAVTAERALLEATGGGCRAPIGAIASIATDPSTGSLIRLLAAAVEPDGTRHRSVQVEGPVDAYRELARVAADRLLERASAETAAS